MCRLQFDHRSSPGPTPSTTPRAEGNTAAVKALDEQIAESKEHAEMFKAVLEKASKRFAALTKVEERHADHGKATLAIVNGAAATAQGVLASRRRSQRQLKGPA